MSQTHLLPVVTPAMRFNAIRIEHDLPAGDLLRRAISKARYVDGFPHSYTTPMIRWAERLLAALWDHTVPMLDILDLASEAETAGWLDR